MEKGYLSLVLHAHLPFVKHPEYEDFLEEDWLYEAITETYLPILSVFEGLVNDGIPWRVTMSLTPTLCAMLSDDLLQSRYLKHIEKSIELSYKEIERTHFEPQFNNLARMYNNKFIEARNLFVDKYKRNLLNGFKYFQDIGNLEIITCGATHGFLPLSEINKTAVKAQIKIAADDYQRIFGRRPRGIWLPECGYLEGFEQLLKDEGLLFFFVDSHGILHATPRPKYGVFAPIYCKNGVAAFGRDVETGKAVWSAKEGYPGDYNYREFYRDIGFDLDYDYIKDYIHVDGTRINTGIKYFRITGPGNHKEPYNPEWAKSKAADHAANFMFNREKQIAHLSGFMGKKPIIVSMYDAELFGHWWYEGPDWINYLIRKINYDQKTFRLVNPFEYLLENKRNQVSTPSLSSWGYKGYAEVWLDGCNDWIYRHMHKAEERMIKLSHEFPNAQGIDRRALNQAARELLLAQSSDWAFIMKMGTVVPYAVKRFKEHIERFTKLYNDIKSKNIDNNYLSNLEYKDSIFPEIDYMVYQA